jgi:hypothetical protein
MDRRTLLGAIAGGAAVLLTASGRSGAARGLDEQVGDTHHADAPAEGAADAQYESWGGAYRRQGRGYGYPGRGRCYWTIDRYGRRVQVCERPRQRRQRDWLGERCWIERDRFGRPVRRCAYW